MLESCISWDDWFWCFPIWGLILVAWWLLSKTVFLELRLNSEENWGKGMEWQDLQEDSWFLKWQGTWVTQILGCGKLLGLLSTPPSPLPTCSVLLICCWIKLYTWCSDGHIEEFCKYLCLFCAFFVPCVLNLEITPFLKSYKLFLERGVRVVCCKGELVSEDGDDFYCPLRFLTLVSVPPLLISAQNLCPDGKLGTSRWAQQRCLV